MERLDQESATQLKDAFLHKTLEVPRLCVECGHIHSRASLLVANMIYGLHSEFHEKAKTGGDQLTPQLGSGGKEDARQAWCTQAFSKGMLGTALCHRFCS